jgi:hypothetical protein
MSQISVKGARKQAARSIAMVARNMLEKTGLFTGYSLMKYRVTALIFGPLRLLFAAKIGILRVC